MQAQKVEEAHKKKDEATKVHLCQLQKAEEQYYKENMWKVHSEWRKILRTAKAEELQNEVKSLYKNFTVKVERKDTTIENLMKHLEEAEEQHRWAFSKHLQVVDGLIDMHRSRMKDMEEEFQEQLDISQQDLNTERKEIMSMHEKQKKELCDMMNAMENDFKECQNLLRQEYEASREEIKNKSTEEYNVLKLSLEGVIEELECRIEETHQAMSRISEEVRMALEKKLQMAQRIIKLGQLNSKLHTEQERIAPFGPLLCSTVAETPVPTDLEQFMTGPESEMEEHKAKNEKCKYSLASMSKHENIDIPENLAPENVDLFKEKRKNSVLRLSSYAIDENGKEVEEWNYLSKFYKCYNKVMLDKMALEIQKKKLNSENMMLQATLQQYLNSTTLSNELMKKVTSLLVQQGECHQLSCSDVRN